MGLLAEALKRAGHLGDAALTVGSSIAGSIPAGVNGLLTLARTGDPDAAAAEVERSSAALQYQPRTEGGRALLAGAGNLIDRGVDAAASLVPAETRRDVGDFLYNASAENPLLYAAAAGALNVADPSKGVGRAANAARGVQSVLNIGHKVGDVVSLDAKRVERALKKTGARVRDHQVRDSNTEPTSIITLDRPLSDTEANLLATMLKQDAIAQKVGDEGFLHGPKAAEWGPFNPDYFLQPEPRKAPYPQFADEYPPIPPPAVKFDKSKGKEFTGRGETPLTKAFTKSRASAQKAVDDGDYEPYFNVAERFDVDPANYPMPGDTRTQGLPKKQATIDAKRREIQTDEARARLQAAFDKGNELGENDRWYLMGQLEREFIDELGEEAGRADFRNLIESLSGTTAGADPKSNLMMAHYGRYMRERGERPGENNFALPVPVVDLKQNMKFFNSMTDGRVLDVSSPKRHNFTANLLGHRRPNTVDEQMTDLITPGKASPQGDSYFAYEELIDEMARKNGLVDDSRAFQDVAWGGHKEVRGKPMIQIINEALARTSMLTGRSQRDVLRQNLIRKKGPLYSAVGGGLLAPYLLDEDEGEYF